MSKKQESQEKFDAFTAEIARVVAAFQNTVDQNVLLDQISGLKISYERAYADLAAKTETVNILLVTQKSLFDQIKEQKKRAHQAQNRTIVISAKYEKAVEDLDNEKKLSWKLEQQILENYVQHDHKQEFLLAELNFMKKQSASRMSDMQLTAKLLQLSQARMIKSNEETVLANLKLQEAQAEVDQFVKDKAQYEEVLAHRQQELAQQCAKYDMEKDKSKGLSSALNKL